MVWWLRVFTISGDLGSSRANRVCCSLGCIMVIQKKKRRVNVQHYYNFFEYVQARDYSWTSHWFHLFKAKLMMPIFSHQPHISIGFLVLNLSYSKPTTVTNIPWHPQGGLVVWPRTEQWRRSIWKLGPKPNDWMPRWER